MQTVIHTETNAFALEQEISFSKRHALSAAMRSGCRKATRAQLGAPPVPMDLGFKELVTVTQYGFIAGQVDSVIGVIAYSDEEYDSLFFVFRSRLPGAGLVAIMGSSYDISRCLDGYLDRDRYRALSWDTKLNEWRQVFSLPDMQSLFADAGVDGLVSGAFLEGRMLAVGKPDFEELDINRVPQLVLDMKEVIIQNGRTERLTMQLRIAV